MEEYINLEDIERDRKETKRKEEINKSKEAIIKVGHEILNFVKATGKGIKKVAENIEAKKQSKSKGEIKPQQESYMMGVARNFAEGSFGSGTSAIPLANAYNKNTGGKRK